MGITEQMYVHGNHKKAQELLDEEKLESSLLHFNKALKEAPNHPDILSHRGVVHLHLNQKKKCLDDLKLSLSLEPENPYRYASLAYAKDFFGDIDGAIADYEKAVELDPEDAVAHNNLGLLLEKKGYQQKAQRNFEKADKLSKKEKKKNLNPILHLRERKFSLESWSRIINPQVKKLFVTYLRNDLSSKSSCYSLE